MRSIRLPIATGPLLGSSHRLPPHKLAVLSGERAPEPPQQPVPQPTPPMLLNHPGNCAGRAGAKPGAHHSLRETQCDPLAQLGATLGRRRVERCFPPPRTPGVQTPRTAPEAAQRYSGGGPRSPFLALRISAGSEAVEEGPVGFAGVEEGADAVVGGAAESCPVSLFLAQSAV